MTHHYTDCGLDYVHLENGYNVHETPYGQGVAIENADELHRAIARWVVSQPHTLRGQELRFLRSVLKLSQSGIGEILGVSRATIARWEGSLDHSIGGSADRALRFFYALKEEGHELAISVCELLSEIDELEYQLSVFEDTDAGWVPKELAA